jgi:hypothetical protein
MRAAGMSLNRNRDILEAKMESVSWGNASTLAANEGKAFWVVGHMIEENNLRHTDQFELKWGRHLRGEKYPDFVPSKEGVRGISIMIYGRMRLVFKRGTETQTVTLQTEGDFVLWQPDVSHNSEFLDDTLVLTIKWPSVENPKDHPLPHNLVGSPA